jgi:hypothetical protein
MPLAIEHFVIWDLGLSAACWGNARDDPSFGKRGAEPIAIVSTVADQLLGRWQDQCSALVVIHLSFGEQQHDGPTLSVADSMQFGVQPAFGTPDAPRNSPF